MCHRQLILRHLKLHGSQSKFIGHHVKIISRCLKFALQQPRLDFSIGLRQKSRSKLHIQIILHRISSGQQGQRVLGLLPLLLERHGHRSQFRIRIFQPLAQRLSRSGFGQTRRFLRAQRLFAGRQTLGQLGLHALLSGRVILQILD